MKSLTKKALAAIEKRGILLVYAVGNKPEPRSIWVELFPKSIMKWEWDADADNRVAELWHMKTELSESRQVVYAKWYQGRATFFSKRMFTLLLAAYGTTKKGVPPGESRNLLEILESDSPLSTKQLKKMSGLQGKLLESTYTKALKTLWNRLEIVGFGEVEDGAFPSLAVGSTKLLFEDLWEEARTLDSQAAQAEIAAWLGEKNPFYRFFQKTLPPRGPIREES